VTDCQAKRAAKAARLKYLVEDFIKWQTVNSTSADVAVSETVLGFEKLPESFSQERVIINGDSEQWLQTNTRYNYLNCCMTRGKTAQDTSRGEYNG